MIDPIYARWSDGVYTMSVDGVTYASSDGMSWIRTDTGDDDAPEGYVRLVGGPMNDREVA